MPGGGGPPAPGGSGAAGAGAPPPGPRGGRGDGVQVLGGHGESGGGGRGGEPEVRLAVRGGAGEVRRSLGDVKGLARALRKAGAGAGLGEPPSKKLRKLREGREGRKTRRLLEEWLERAAVAAAEVGGAGAAAWQDFVDSRVESGFGRVRARRERAEAAGVGEADVQRARDLNQYFTNEASAEALVKLALAHLPAGAAGRLQELAFVEPSAGDGALFRHFPEEAGRRVGVDLDAALAQRHGWICGDFLTLSREDLGLGGVPRGRTVAVVNPPFADAAGRDLPLRFLERALALAGTVAIGLPARLAARVPPGLAAAEVFSGPPARVPYAFCGRRVLQPSVFKVFRRPAGPERPP